MSSGNMEVARYRRGPSFLEDHRLVGKVDGEDMDVAKISLRKHETLEAHSRACGIGFATCVLTTRSLVDFLQSENIIGS